MTLTQKQVDHLLAIMDIKIGKLRAEVQGDPNLLMAYNTAIAQHIEILLELPK